MRLVLASLNEKPEAHILAVAQAHMRPVLLAAHVVSGLYELVPIQPPLKFEAEQPLAMPVVGEALTGLPTTAVATAVHRLLPESSLPIKRTPPAKQAP